MTRATKREWLGQHLTVRQANGIPAQGRYSGHQLAPAAAYAIRPVFTGLVYVSDGEVEYLGFPVKEETAWTA